MRRKQNKNIHRLMQRIAFVLQDVQFIFSTERFVIPVPPPHFFSFYTCELITLLGCCNV